MFNRKQKTQVSLPREEWESLCRLASEDQAQALFNLWERKLNLALRDLAHQPLKEEFSRGKLSGQLEIIETFISEMRAYREVYKKTKGVTKAEGDMKEIVEKLNKKRIS